MTIQIIQEIYFTKSMVSKKNLTMTEINLNDQFEELVQVTLQEQQDNGKSAKSQNFFQDNNAIK